MPSFIDCSQRLQDKIREGLHGDKSCVFSPVCVLHNPNTEYKYECRYIKNIGIFQDFITSYMDIVQITTDVTPGEHAELMQNLKDMECTLILYPFDDKTLTMIYDQEPEIYKMRVIVDEQIDLEKKFNINMFGDSTVEKKDDSYSYLTAEQHSATIPFVFHMCEPEAYELRHVQLNTVFSKLTPESLAHWICQQFRVVEEVSIIPPDHKETLENVVIPPMHNISTIFPFIQERYAMYSKGLGYYFTNKTFYIFPAFDTAKETSPVKGTLQIINAPEKYFQGLDRYHNTVDDDILVVSMTPVDIKPLNMEGSENVGNIHVSTNADKMRDNFVNVSEEGKVTRGEKDIAIVAMQNQAGNIQSDIQNVSYRGERTNVYSSTSEMAMINATRMKTGWVRAYPRIIKPGQNVLYHFDAKMGLYKTQKGRILRVFYAGNVHPSDSNKPWVSFNANMEIHLEADKQSEEEY